MDNVCVHHLWEAQEARFEYGFSKTTNPTKQTRQMLVSLYGEAHYEVASAARIRAGEIRIGDAVLAQVQMLMHSSCMHC